MRDIAYRLAKERIAQAPRQATYANLERLVTKHYPGREFAAEIREGVHQAIKELPRSAKQVLAEAIRVEPAPVMKAAGFKKTRNTWHRWCSWGCQVVNVQATQYSDRSETMYTLNIGAYLRDQKTWNGEQFDEAHPPSEAYCQLRQRVGVLMPDHNDKWWRVMWADDAAHVGAIMKNTLVDFILPVLDASRDDVALFRSKVDH